MQNYKTILISI